MNNEVIFELIYQMKTQYENAIAMILEARDDVYDNSFEEPAGRARGTFTAICIAFGKDENEILGNEVLGDD